MLPGGNLHEVPPHPSNIVGALHHKL